MSERSSKRAKVEKEFDLVVANVNLARPYSVGSQLCDIGIKDGKIKVVSKQIDPSKAVEVIQGSNLFPIFLPSLSLSLSFSLFVDHRSWTNLVEPSCFQVMDWPPFLAWLMFISMLEFTKISQKMPLQSQRPALREELPQESLTSALDSIISIREVPTKVSWTFCLVLNLSSLYCIPELSLVDFFPEVLEKSKGNYYVDYCYHLAPISKHHITELERLATQDGVTSFKIFMFYGQTSSYYKEGKQYNRNTKMKINEFNQAIIRSQLLPFSI